MTTLDIDTHVFDCHRRPITETRPDAVPDIPALRKMWEHITAHPDEHNQHEWGQRTACGTTACAAGHLVLQSADHEAVWSPGDPDEFDDPDGIFGVRRPDGTVCKVPEAARDIGGLNDHQAHQLFFGALDLQQVGSVLHDITKGEVGAKSGCWCCCHNCMKGFHCGCPPCFQ